MILSFELPFALIPLLKFTSSKTKMGSHANPVAVRNHPDALIYFLHTVVEPITNYKSYMCKNTDEKDVA